MRGAETRRPVYRFGSFELETESGELRKQGTRIKFQDQPLQILVLLLEHAGEVVTREQIQNKLWPPGTYVGYDNASMARCESCGRRSVTIRGIRGSSKPSRPGISIHRRH